MGKKRKPICVSFDLGEFTVRITDKRVDVETKSKLWKMVFLPGTWDYNFWSYMLIPEIWNLPPAELEERQKNRAQEQENVKEMARALFAATSTMLRDTTILKPMYELLDESTRRQLAAQEEARKAAGETDEQVLAEQRALHEKDPDSILAAHEAKKPKNNGRKKSDKADTDSGQ